MKTHNYTLTETERSLVKIALETYYDFEIIKLISGQNEEEMITALKKKFDEPIPEVKPEPLWRTDLFTEEDQNTMATVMMEEVGGSLKEYAHDELDKMDLLELIGLIDEDCEITAACLQAIVDGHTCLADYLSNEHEEHYKAAQFIRRFKLINHDMTEVTPLGLEYINIHG
jgi:hypothetical protein